jgi:site-specific DNA-methyltransferase (adenine-specific)
MVVNIEDAGFEIRDMLGWLYGSGFPKSHNIGHKVKEYKGWGTALKPAHEPIVMARKPFNTSVAENVLTHGTGGINIDECRVGTDEGRFPANIIHDGSEEVLEIFPETTSGKMSSKHTRHTDESPHGIYGKFDINHPLGETYGDTGTAARFFYCAKASKAERGNKNNHPTVKPIKLMEYLVRLVTPKEGIVLEPFAGSGTTLIACKQQGFNYIGIEREQEYCDIAEARLKGVKIQGTLF